MAEQNMPMKRILLLLLMAATSLDAAAGADLNLRIQRSGGVTALSWSPRLIAPADGPSILPDYEVQWSSDLHSWQALHRIRGGLGLDGGPMSFAPPLFGSDGPVFFRLLEQVTLPGADLRGIDLTRADLTGANLAGARLGFATLSNANLTYADLSGADLGYADLTYANLRGANLTNALLDGTVRLYTIMPDGGLAADDPDAETIALETGGELLAPEALYLRIRRDLAAIRAAFPEMALIHESPPWEPGVLLGLYVSPSEVELLNESEFAPVRVWELAFDMSVLEFPKPYNPEVLAQILYSRFGISPLWPNGVGGDGDYIAFDSSSSPYRYTFSIGYGDCQAGCTGRDNWIFTVSDEGAVRLVEEP